MVNVKTPYHGTQKKNPFLAPISSLHSENLMYLDSIVAWLKLWKESCHGKEKKTNGFTSETFMAMIQTTETLASLARYLLTEKKYEYVLLGKVQSDPLEKRFGWYRQLAGANYFVSARQILEAEKSIRIRSLVKFSGYTLSEIRDNFEVDLKKESDYVGQVRDALLAILERDQLDLDCGAVEDRNILFYVAGYCARSLAKVCKCSDCVLCLKEEKEMPCLDVLEEDSFEGADRSFIQQIDRGGLIYPSDIVYMSVLHIWTFIMEICQHEKALDVVVSSTAPQAVFVNSFIYLCRQSEETKALLSLSCDQGHSFERFVVLLARKMFNIFAKNYSRDKNSDLHKKTKRQSSTSSSSRKVKKLQSE